MPAIVGRITQFPDVGHKTAPVVIDAEFIISQRYDKTVLSDIQPEIRWRPAIVRKRAKYRRDSESRHDNIVIELAMDMSSDRQSIFRMRMEKQVN